METREYTNKLIEMAEEGLISGKDLAIMCLKWMSEDEVVEMTKANDLLLEEED